MLCFMCHTKLNRPRFIRNKEGELRCVCDECLTFLKDVNLVEKLA